MIGRWWYHEARPWEFWYPQSGAAGGAIIGGMMFALDLMHLWIRGQ